MSDQFKLHGALLKSVRVCIDFQQYIGKDETDRGHIVEVAANGTIHVETARGLMSVEREHIATMLTLDTYAGKTWQYRKGLHCFDAPTPQTEYSGTGILEVKCIACGRLDSERVAQLKCKEQN